MNLEQRIAEALREHFFHTIEFTGRPAGRWLVQCNCDEIVSAATHPEAEGAFAAHQTAVLAGIVQAELAEAWEQGQKSGMRHADRVITAAKMGRPDLPGHPSPNPYRTPKPTPDKS